MNWAVKLSITEQVVTVAERAPRTLAGTSRTPQSAAAGTKTEQRRRCAVVIDRDPEVVSGLCALLAPQLDVHSAHSPLSAALLLDRLEHVDLAFVELELPDFAGEQLLQQLGRWPDAIRVLTTQTALPDAAVPEAVSSSAASQERALRGPALRRSSTLVASKLPRNAYLAHLVLSKPISAQVVGALQRATLGLLRV